MQWMEWWIFFATQVCQNLEWNIGYLLRKYSYFNTTSCEYRQIMFLVNFTNSSQFFLAFPALASHVLYHQFTWRCVIKGTVCTQISQIYFILIVLVIQRNLLAYSLFQKSLSNLHLQINFLFRFVRKQFGVDRKPTFHFVSLKPSPSEKYLTTSKTTANC